MIKRLNQQEQKVQKNLNIYWINLFLVLIAISAPWLGNLISAHDLIKSYFSYFGISILAIITLYFKTLNSDFKLNLSYFKLVLLLFFIFGTCSIFWSNNFDFTINKWLIWLTAFLSFIVTSNIHINTKNLIKLSWGLLLAGGTIAIIGILQFLLDPFALSQSAAPGSTFANRNIAIQPLVLITPVFIFLLLSKYTQSIRVWILSVITSLIFIYLFYVSSRAAWLAILIQLILIAAYFLNYKLNRYKWIDWNKNKRNATFFGLIISFIMCSLTSEGFVDILNITGQDVFSLKDSFEYLESGVGSESNIESWRYEIWKTALNMIHASPIIGTGLGTYSHNLANEGYASWLINNTFRVHNDLIELLVEIGILGGVIFGLVVVMIILSIITILKNIKGELHLFFYLTLVILSGSFLNYILAFLIKCQFQFYYLDYTLG